MTDAKLTAITQTTTAASSDLVYVVLYPATSPLSRKMIINDFKTAVSAAGEANTATNLGTGIEVFREKSGTALNLRTLIGGTNITITSATSAITIAGPAAAGEVNLGENLGTGIGVYREKSGASLLFKSLSAGANLNLASAASVITLTGINTTNSATNLGTGGYGTFKETAGNQHQFKTLVAGKDITLSSAASIITIANAASSKSFSLTIGASNTWNNELIPIWQGPRSGCATLIEVDATTSGTNTPILNFNLQRRDFGAMNSAGVDIFAASQAADADGLSQTSFATSVVASKNHLMFTTGSGAEGGSVNYLQLTVYYEV